MLHTKVHRHIKHEKLIALSSEEGGYSNDFTENRSPGVESARA